jgi:beta-phosphoglucomutase
MKNIKFVFFDMDGCLIDSEYMFVHAWYELFQELDIPIEFNEILTWRGKNDRLINGRINEFMQDMDATINLRKVRDERFYKKLNNNEVKLKAYAIEIMDYLDSKQIPYALVTSTNREKASRLLTHFNLIHRFNFTVFGDDVKDAKPNPDIYLKAISLSNVNADEIIAFEDSKNGIEACNRAFVDVVYVPDRDRIDIENLIIFDEVFDFNEGIELIRKFID